MPEYVATNVSARSAVGETADRQVLRIDGTRLHPERTYAFDEFTSDVLEGMVNGNLQVETDEGVLVTIDRLENQGLELKTKTVTERSTNVDGRVDRSHTKYYLEETEETGEADEEPNDGEELSNEETSSEETSSEETSDEETTGEENSEEETSEEEPSVEEASSEDSGEETVETEDEEPSEDPAESSVLQELKDNGVIPEDAETSSDVNAAPMAKIIRKVGDRIPDEFFEGESRKTVNAALEEV